MNELFDLTTTPANLIPTILISFVILYWITVIIGMIDMDTIDVDVDTGDVDVDIHAEVDADIDADIHADIHSDADVDTDAHFSASWFNSALAFFNLGQIPFMIFLSFVALPFWIISIIATDYIGITSFWFSLVILVPNMVISLFISKIFTTPFVRLFGKIDAGTITDVDLIGKTGTVVLPIKPGKMGQIEVVIQNKTHKLYAVNKNEPIPRDANVLIIRYDDKEKQYEVEAYDTNYLTD